MKKGNKEKILTIAVIIILISLFSYAVIYFVGKMNNSSSTNSTNMDSFAKCLASNNVKMYGAYWCGHCQNQKKSFGDSWQYIDYVECDPNGQDPQTDLCLARGIEGYPTWEIKGLLYPGEIALDKLAELSGCKL